MGTENISNNEELQAIIHSLRTPSGQVDSAFIQQFFGRMPVSELQPEETDHYAALVEDFFEFARQRTRRQVKCRIYNPSDDTHGWSSRHTVIELINDDIIGPFVQGTARIATVNGDRQNPTYVPSQDCGALPGALCVCLECAGFSR